MTESNVVGSGGCRMSEEVRRAIGSVGPFVLYSDSPLAKAFGLGGSAMKQQEQPAASQEPRWWDVRMTMSGNYYVMRRMERGWDENGGLAVANVAAATDICRLLNTLESRLARAEGLAALADKMAAYMHEPDFMPAENWQCQNGHLWPIVHPVASVACPWCRGEPIATDSKFNEVKYNFSKKAWLAAYDAAKAQSGTEAQ